MFRWPSLVFLVACSSDANTLSKLDGDWQGTLTDGENVLPLVATFSWKAEDEILFGQVQVQIPNEAAPSIFAVRRSDVSAGEAHLDLTDTADITRGFDLDGTVDETAFSGTGTVTIACDTGACGYSGPMDLSPGGPGLTTPFTVPGGT